MRVSHFEGPKRDDKEPFDTGRRMRTSRMRTGGVVAGRVGALGGGRWWSRSLVREMVAVK